MSTRKLLNLSYIDNDYIMFSMHTSLPYEHDSFIN